MESSPASSAPLDKLTPFFFGPAEKQLFGLYHTPQPGEERDFGVLICNPWGQEFVRAHRALSQLGLRLARQGFPVLRFDYFATGDSAGDDAEGSFGQWQADVRAAIQELKRRARVERVFLVGLRLGASLAVLVSSGRDDVEGLVLWEPAVSGGEYVQDLTVWHEEKQFYFLAQHDESAQRTELLGFGLHETLLADLAGLDLTTIKRKPAGQVLIVENAAEASPVRPSFEAFRERLTTLGARAAHRRIESFQMWSEDPDKGLVPQAILEAAIAWLLEAAV